MKVCGWYLDLDRGEEVMTSTLYYHRNFNWHTSRLLSTPAVSYHAPYHRTSTMADLPIILTPTTFDLTTVEGPKPLYFLRALSALSLCMHQPLVEDCFASVLIDAAVYMYILEDATQDTCSLVMGTVGLVQLLGRLYCDVLEERKRGRSLERMGRSSATRAGAEPKTL